MTIVSQHDADLEHDRLDAAIKASPELARPSAITGMLAQAFSETGENAQASALLLLHTINEIVDEREQDMLIPTPVFWQEVISTAYYRMYYELARHADNGTSEFANADTLRRFTDWLVASLRGESVPATFEVEGLH